MSEKLVCKNCFEEAGIIKFITCFGEKSICSFCNKESMCIPIECVTEHVMECLSPFYTNDPEGVYDSEDGLFWEEMDPFDILHETVFNNSDIIPNYEDPICIELRKGFGDGIWTRRDPYGESFW